MKCAALMLLLASHCAAPPVVRAETFAPDLARIKDRAAWTVHHAEAESTKREGRAAVRLRAEGDSADGLVGLALPQAVKFSVGTIDIDLKGKNLKQRSFLGVAFNVEDEKTFEAVYFRPFNFQADDATRGRSVQYIAWPNHTWEQLRKSEPGRFEQPVHPVPDPDGWFHAQIEVTATQVRVFVNHARKPSLVVTRLSRGGSERPVGLFVDTAEGEYADLVIAPHTARKP